MESWEIALQKRQAIVNDAINTLESIINNGITNIRLYNGNGFNGYLFKSVNNGTNLFMYLIMEQL